MADTDSAKGKLKEMGGAVQEKAGQATGNEDMEARGTANKQEGKAQNAVGKVKDAAKDVKDAVKENT
jgi:uncharacterized protein YjbJ (UPF0337 family)